ncbi:hypothetical protein EYF80_042998 [Liparis tanakae]|uniref:Uncharacterized protein n=1 Tax=Liparis tanakae TaxID=230148 RepID=A0A4Z2FZW2_9TELE|nr:hypothetical protein EYF80_042998 [Liparis tanakae]
MALESGNRAAGYVIPPPGPWHSCLFRSPCCPDGCSVTYVGPSCQKQNPCYPEAVAPASGPWTVAFCPSGAMAAIRRTHRWGIPFPGRLQLCWYKQLSAMPCHPNCSKAFCERLLAHSSSSRRSGPPLRQLWRKEEEIIWTVCLTAAVEKSASSSVIQLAASGVQKDECLLTWKPRLLT